MSWYALHVRSNYEHLVAVQLERAGVEAFYPHMLEPSRDRRREIEKKFMPGYVFGHFELSERTPIVAIPQVVRILGWGARPAAIPDDEIEGVRKIVSFPKIVTPGECEYVAEGDLVRVCRGPLTGLEGFVVHRKNSTRIVVSVTMLGRSIAAEVDRGSLELLQQAKLPKAA